MDRPQNILKTRCRTPLLPVLLSFASAGLSLPNILSLSRILCIPFIAYCIIHFHEYNNYRYIGLFIMVYAGLSDSLDGYVARKRDETSILGVYLDSIADKLLLITISILLSCDNLWPEVRFPNWYPILVLINEFIVTAGALTITYLTGKILRPSIFSKISTGIQICAIIIVLAGSILPMFLTVAMLRTSALFISVSMFYYIYIGLSQERNVVPKTR